MPRNLLPLVLLLVFAATGQADTLRVKNLKILCVIYRGAADNPARMDEAAVTQAKNGFELAREFYFRNTRGRLNCELHWRVFDQAAPETAGPTMDAIVEHLKSQGVRDGEFDGLVVTGVELKGNFGGWTLLGGAGGCFGLHGVRGNLDWYPEDRPDVAYGTAWIFVHEFQHALDLSICENSGRPDMLHGHPYVDRDEAHFQGGYQGGEHFDWIAVTLREFDDYLSLKGATNSFLECEDADGDGLADEDPRLPMDERRFGSDPTKRDTDGDGLDDLAEFCANRYRGSDPTERDTDGDGRADGEDRYPVIPIAQRLEYRVKPSGGDGAARSASHELPLLIDEAFVRNDEGGPLAIRAAWNEEALFLEFSGPRPFVVHAKLDGTPANGFWEGGDTYLLRIDADGVKFAGLGLSGPAPTLAHQAQQDEQAGYTIRVTLPAALGQGVSKEINFGGPRDPADVVSGLTLVNGRELAFNLIYEFENGKRAVLTPHHTMYAVELVKPADAPEVILLRGPAETNAPLPELQVLGAAVDSKVDVMDQRARLVGTRIGPGPVLLAALPDDGRYDLTVQTEHSQSLPHRLLVDRSAAPPRLRSAGGDLVAECEPGAAFELWWGLDGLPVAPLDGGRAGDDGMARFPAEGSLGDGWVVTAYDDDAFQQPAFSEAWQKIDRNFQGGPADPRLPPDHFSYRFQGYLDIATAGDYEFELSSDDGARLWLADQLRIDHWGLHGLTPKHAQIHLEPGLHPVRLDYYELAGWAGLKLRWRPAGGEWSFDLPVRRLPVALARIELFGRQTDRFGNQSAFSSPLRLPAAGEQP